MHPGDPRHPRLTCRLLALTLVLAVAAAAGCGGGSTGNGTTAPTASAPDATAPPADATQPGTGPATTPPATTTQPAPTRTQPETGGGGEGERRGARNVRVPATFMVVAGSRLKPRTVTVPPFLAIRLTLRAGDGQAHRLVLQTPEGYAVDLGPERREASVRIPGQRAGRYAIKLDYEPKPVATLVVGGELGP